jgi:hypothetical protein
VKDAIGEEMTHRSRLTVSFGARVRTRARGSMLLFLFACTAGPGDDTAPSDEPKAGESDNEHYDRVAGELEGYRTEFLDEEADELWARGNRLFWLTFPGFDPVLHSWDATSDTQVDYEFSIGSDVYSYRASDDLVVTAEVSGGDVTYHAYAIDAPADELGSTTFDQPTDGTRWHAYAASGNRVYIVAVSYEETALYAWEPPGRPTRMWSFDELGYELGEFWDFDVEGDTMIFIESGRIWRADVRTGAGEWLGNPTLITGGVSYDDSGVVWAGDYSLYWFEYGADDVVNLTDTINTADYRFNETYSSAHQVIETGFWRQRDKLVYESLSGLYMYHLQTGEFTPIVLEARQSDLRVTWRDPVMLENGTLFATGLESESGSVGADGPVWRIDHPALQ